jgi:predicted enzyme related to lactoylglutathione lyase
MPPDRKSSVTGPARAGLFLYAKDLERLAAFYEAVLGMSRVRPSADLVVLNSPDIQLLVHAIPPAIAESITITTPPQRREDSAMKFFFTVPGIAAAEAIVAGLGGVVFPEQWAGPGFNVRNACDPEGNVFQIRETAC